MSVDPALARAFLAAAARAADAAGEAVRGHADDGAVVRKRDGSPSIVADRLAEQAALEHLVPLGVRIISEEGFGTGAPPAAGEPWLALDPLDGTGNFRAGLLPFALSVGLIVDGRAVAGLVHEHVSGRRWEGGVGLGARRDGRAIAPGTSRTVMVPSPDVGSPAVLPPGFHRLRISGCTATDLAAVADGSAGAWHNLDRAGTHTHDVAGALGVAAGAGCIVRDWSGGELVLPSDVNDRIKFVLAGDAERAGQLAAAFPDPVPPRPVPR
ncbi:inositol monophosphatase family protein [Jatrophihabitans fulvus]